MKKVIAVVLLVAVVIAIAAIAIHRNGMTISYNGKEVIALVTSEPKEEWEFVIPMATPVPTATPEPVISGHVVDDEGYHLFVGNQKEARNFFGNLGFQIAVNFAANKGEYYGMLPEEVEVLRQGDGNEWSVELLEWEDEVEVYRLGNRFPVAKEDGSIVESSSEKSVATMSDRKASKEAFCTAHKALRSNWVVHEVHPEAPNWLGSLKESAGFTPDLFGALVAYKVTTTVDGQKVEGYRLVWRVCDCEYVQKQTASSKPNGNKKPSATKKPSKPTATPTLKPTATPTLKPTATPTLKPTATPGTDHNPPSVTPEPTATPGHNPPRVTPEPQPTKAPALGEDAGTSSSGSGSSSSSHSKPSTSTGTSNSGNVSSSAHSSSSSESSSSSSHSKPGVTPAPALGD